MNRLKLMRKEKKMTQQQVADLVGISLRSYKSYENEPEKADTIKYNYIIDVLSRTNVIDEENGILDIKDITEKCSEVFRGYDVNFCYLFGSYAKGKASQSSDVDLLISANLKGLKFFGLVEELRTALRKRVDALDIRRLKDNIELTEEILKDGIKIYGVTDGRAVLVESANAEKRVRKLMFYKDGYWIEMDGLRMGAKDMGEFLEWLFEDEIELGRFGTMDVK